ncbi:hypothetical protein PIROE2DRAFT_8491 [Piromyces sp. E2]|nr:hypothetical protein PIROE2DRAFT_8491 [Piromyces sp. E2]|eukprot:OUM64654.1 hypothetical protein PIROE2DRAFT_8491 [Piromyces sp. E2]
MPIRIKLSFEPPFPPIRCIYAIKAKENYIKNLKENIVHDILSHSQMDEEIVERINLSLVKLSLDGFELVDSELAKDVIRNDDLISVEYVDEKEVEMINRKRKKILKHLSTKRRKLCKLKLKMSDDECDSGSSSDDSSSSSSSSSDDNNSKSSSDSDSNNDSDDDNDSDKSGSDSSSSSDSSRRSSSSSSSSSEFSSDKTSEPKVYTSKKKENKNNDYNIAPPLSLGMHKMKVVKGMKNMKSSHVYFDDENEHIPEKIPDDTEENDTNEPQMIITYADLHDTPQQKVQDSRTRKRRRRNKANKNKNKNNNGIENSINYESNDNGKSKNVTNVTNVEKSNQNNNININDNHSMNNDNNVNKVNQKLNKGKNAVTDYSQLEPLGDKIEVGKRIAYKTLEISEFSPGYSDFKEATVLNYDSTNNKVTLKLDPQYVHGNEIYSDMFDNSKDTDIEVEVEDVSYDKEEIFTVNLNEIYEVKILN